MAFSITLTFLFFLFTFTDEYTTKQKTQNSYPCCDTN